MLHSSLTMVLAMDSFPRVGNRSVLSGVPVGQDRGFVETDPARIVKSTVPVCGWVGIGKGHPEPSSEWILAS